MYISTCDDNSLHNTQMICNVMLSLSLRKPWSTLYSGTSINGHFQQWIPTLQWTTMFVITITSQLHQNSIKDFRWCTIAQWVDELVRVFKKQMKNMYLPLPKIKSFSQAVQLVEDVKNFLQSHHAWLLSQATATNTLIDSVVLILQKLNIIFVLKR